ncbi:pyridoxamine 5'-phosphate oxidase family protein [Nocardioides sp. WS12]|uniref:pyridoxamine 5'-phosphate oxidase family protein n=1 Tax=Nocardioides sp. WS12 TaxID=2486272 RepID=UPI0015FB3977|nr:pyridoxamine 5'-phosphate oxidase family protein [Nocardioides sp. WS12]
MPAMTDLTTDECEDLLRSGVFGRLVMLAGPREVEVFPVNYVTVDDAVLARTAAGTMLDRYADGAVLLFEVDDVDYERGHGWSVVARGYGERVSGVERTETERHVPGPPRWLRREDDVWIRLRWDELSGRQLGTGWDRAAEMPVRRAWR